MHDGIPYGQNQGQGQGHSREVDRQSPTGLIFFLKTPARPMFPIEIMVWSYDLFINFVPLFIWRRGEIITDKNGITTANINFEKCNLSTSYNGSVIHRKQQR